jgi:hypothetical protein
MWPRQARVTPGRSRDAGSAAAVPDAEDDRGDGGVDGIENSERSVIYGQTHFTVAERDIKQRVGQDAYWTAPQPITASVA